MFISQRAASIKSSPTLQVTAKVKALSADGVAVINLGAGEPDFDTPVHIREAAIAAINSGKTRYTAVDGTHELKQAIQEKFKHENSLDYDLQQISVAAGAKHSLYNLFQATLNPADEVIIPTPYWVSYPDMVTLTGAKSILLTTTLESSFKITAEQLDAAITPKTRLLILNSPSNPTGSSYSKKELTALAEVLLQHPDVYVVTDDIYEHILWTEEGFCNILNACPALYERCIVVNGVSKAYAMTGWRIGYAAGPQAIIAAMNKIQSQSTSNPCSISQAAAVAALGGEQDCIRKNTTVFKRRHDLVLSALQEIPDIQCYPGDGTFYTLPNAQNLIARLPSVEDDIGLANFFLDEAKVALVPGSAFGSPGYIRLSFAIGEEQLQAAMNALQKAVANNL